MVLQRYAARISFLLALLALILFFSVSLRTYSSFYIDLATNNVDTITFSVEKNRSELVLEKNLRVNPDNLLHRYAIDFPSAAPRAINLTIESGEIRDVKAFFESLLISVSYSCPSIYLKKEIVQSDSVPANCNVYQNNGKSNIVFPVIQKSGLQEVRIHWQGFFSGLIFSIATFFMAMFMFRINSSKLLKSRGVLLNARSCNLYLLAAYFFIAFLSFNLHSSSIGVWKAYVPSTPTNGVLLGEPRAIRSDEWLVQTPLIASEVEHDFRLSNPALGADGSSLVAGVPVNGVHAFFQPRYWGFYLFGFEKGLSWLYAWRIFGLILTGFTLFSLITRGDFYLSLVGSLWIFLSPFTQWWFGTNLPDMLIGMMGGISSLYFLFFAKKISNQIIGAIFFLLFSISFVFALYPPFQVPLMYCGVFILLGLIFRDISYYPKMTKMTGKIATLFLALLAIFSILLIWYLQAKNIISIVQSSAYPGARVSLGGDFPANRFFAGLFGQFLSENSYPLSLGNVCEAASMLLLFPVAWVALIYRWKGVKKIDALSFFLSLYLLLMIVWMFVGFPNFLALATKFSLSPPYRSFVGIGIGSIFLVISVFSLNASLHKAIYLKDRFFWLAFLFSASLILVSLYFLYLSFPDFLTPFRTGLILLTCLVLIYALLSSNKTLFIIAIMSFCINGLWVNPISSGVNVLRNSELKVLIHEEQASGNGMWLVSPGTIYPQYFKVLGANVWNGVRFITSPGDMSSLDPDGKNRDIWYRYAHISVDSLPSGSQPIFKLKQSDLYELSLDLCSKGVQEMGITNFVFVEKQEAMKVPCLELVRPFPVSGFWIYRRKIE